MKYLILFGIIAAVAAAGAVVSMRRLGNVPTLVLGGLLSIAAIVLFVFNKSDSVADTAIEHVADTVPPLVTLSCVFGWWAGYLLMRVIAGFRA